MQLRDNVILLPNLLIQARDIRTGRIETIRSRNLIVDDGIELIRDLIGGTGLRPSHIGLGTGVTAVDPSDTSIETEQYRDEVTRRDALTAANEFQLFLGLNDGNGFTYTEAGLLQTGFQNGDPGDAAKLVAHATFSGVAKTSSVELTLTWTINIAAC